MGGKERKVREREMAKEERTIMLKNGLIKTTQSPRIHVVSLISVCPSLTQAGSFLVI